jgi:hypothetical protein
MEFSTEIRQKFVDADKVFVPKGENRETVDQLFGTNEITVPVFAGRCLHLGTGR